MNKYEEALIDIEHFYGEDGEEIVMAIIKSYDLLLEAIEKATKYDELNKIMTIDDKLTGVEFLKNLDKEYKYEIHKLHMENTKLKKALKVYQENTRLIFDDSMDELTNFKLVWLLMFNNNWNVQEITQEQYELLKEVENE